MNFDKEEIILDPVPLNKISTQILTIYNDGYNNTSIKGKVSQEHSHIPINIKFVNGS